jgi:pSer/pThr/pTyr-binding forkhead associated (FHA) protein
MQPPDPPPTSLESDEEIRLALEARRARLTGKPKTAAGAVPEPAAPREVEVQLERVVLRPPMALLYVADDGRRFLEGDCIRLRKDSTLIGRDKGDVLIPHDGLISAPHAEIVRQQAPNGWRWLLRDFRSRNGTFVRIGSTLLKPGNEFIIGSARFQFEAAALPAAVAAASAPTQGTQPWGSQPAQPLLPSLLEVGPKGPVQRYRLLDAECWIGRGPQCAIVRANDPLVNDRHACVYRDQRGEWHVKNNASVNGLWFRVPDVLPIGPVCHFRLGEQRFYFRVLER